VRDAEDGEEEDDGTGQVPKKPRKYVRKEKVLLSSFLV
jgi:hypothetical protein